jgi:hypothetical protein
MATDSLTSIHRANLVLGVVATTASGLLWDGRAMLAAGLGACLAIANFWTVRRLGVRAIARVAGGDSPRQALILVAGLTIKMAVLTLLVWVAIRKLALPVLPFSLGLSALVFSILIVGLFLGVDPGAAASVAATPGGSVAAPPAGGPQKI